MEIYRQPSAMEPLLPKGQFFLVFPPSSVQAKGNPSGIPQTLSAESGGEIANPQTASAQFEMAEIRSTPSSIFQTPSGKLQTGSAQLVTPLALTDLARAFRLPWSHYVLLIRRSRSPEAFAFYHTEALRGGWSVRQLQRQMDSEYLATLPEEKVLAAELAKTRKQLEARK